MNPILKEIAAIQSNPEDVYVIHYSQYVDENKTHYPKRVSCIYAQNLNGSESSKFSIGKYAAKNKIDLAVIADWYDDLEIYVLDDFNTFLRTKLHCTFIYWAEEGQELMLDMIKDRYEEVSKNEEPKPFYTVSPSNRKTVQQLVTKVDLNSDTCKDLKQFIKYHNKDKIVTGFLNSAEENVCFDKGDFNKIDASVVAKTSFFVSLINTCSTADPNENTGVDDESVDLEKLSLGGLFKRLSIKSWVFLIGIFVAIFTAGKWTASFEPNDLKKQNTQLQKELNDQKQRFEDSLKIYQDSLAKK